VPPTLLDRVYQRSLAVCDKLDGAADGIVSDVPACRKREAEVLSALRCAPAARGPANPAASSTLDSTIARAQHDDKCLTDSQLATLMILRDGLKLPYRLAWDVSGYPGYNIFAGTRMTGGLGLGHDATRLAMPTFNANGYLFSQGDGYLRYFVAQDASYNALGFDVQQPGRYQQQLVDLSQTIGAMNPDLARYIARGGKLITVQGLADEVISPNQTIAFYRGLIDRYGKDTVDSFMRLYMVPGFQHGNGVFIPAWDELGALDEWVSNGVAPETLLGSDIAPATNGRTRPICRYPGYPRYLGKGSINLAANFRCMEP
jgi:feruloyl esterase